MTTFESRPRDERLVKKIAERYASEGYEVLAEPSSDRLPEFLKPFRPDMIARRGEESIVVEIKANAEAELPELRAIASEIAKQPGWRLDVVIGDSASPLRTLSPSELGSQLEEARSLLAGHPAAGELLLWSAFEGVARRAAALHGVSLSPGITPQALAKSLLAHGFIEDEESERLVAAARRRNGLAHGFTTAPDRGLSTVVLNVAERLLREIPEDRAA